MHKIPGCQHTDHSKQLLGHCRKQTKTQAVKQQKGLEVFQLHTHLARFVLETLAFWPSCISWKREIMGSGNRITGKNPYFLASFVEHF